MYQWCWWWSVIQTEITIVCLCLRLGLIVITCLSPKQIIIVCVWFKRTVSLWSRLPACGPDCLPVVQSACLWSRLPASGPDYHCLPVVHTDYHCLWSKQSVCLWYKQIIIICLWSKNRSSLSVCGPNGLPLSVVQSVCLWSKQIIIPVCIPGSS